ncbi:bifunctional aldolase/short-chain dehydrogenase [Reichenbachiella carrageenanivorans]|uniref:Bifunctional aldolase/short-chain dehydrogenase n=1 Tax=Reichenbachiella carrageenanivorans TaxID=2979869 RepID=A0ABY6D4D3_9BACT|nr:bifunctional aldolase/short-chain dehydrogenase [Reichenbachiella carrageenanivorans]UXX81006.1 bifunctional aldolase/short-chain dehydrogenase [Reichenbachiella carrageenanivorans]
MSKVTTSFKYVDYLWDDAKAAALAGDEIALFIYRSNILGADLRITNYGGGNTSVKLNLPDPLTKEETEIMYVKGSGGDIGTLTKGGCAGLYVDKLRALKNVYRGIEHEDEMVGLFNHCIYDLDSKAPSIDTPLHALLPYKHIDHLHPDAAIAIAASKDGEAIMKEIYGDDFAWIPWQKPGFDLSLQLEEAITKNPNMKGLYLGGHGLFTWGDTSYECYINSLESIEKASAYLEANYGKKGPVFGGQKVESLAADARQAQASAIAPILRGLCSSNQRMVGHFSDDDRVLEFANSNDLERLAQLGTSCPDHFLRTKICPLVLELPKDADVSDAATIVEKIKGQWEAYRAYYNKYYEDCKRDNSPAIRDNNPVVIIWPGVGMFSFAKNKQTARVANEFYINAINVMKGAEAVSEYVALPLQEAFDIEYWLLEEAKLQRMPKEQSLSRKVALISGSGGGIGLEIAKKFVENGACVVITDIDEERVKEAHQSFKRDTATWAVMDVTSIESIKVAFKKAALEFGGVDIIVNNAGIATSKSLEATTEKDWDLLYDILVKGTFAASQAGVEIIRAQNLGGGDLGGDIVNIVSKNAIVAGPNNLGYGSAKAAQAHMTRLLAAELGGDKIRVNTVNPDAVIKGSNIWAGGWAEGRAKAYGITVEELPAFYAKRTLLNAILEGEDMAKAALTFVDGSLSKSTGNILNVDGGVAAAFVR